LGAPKVANLTAADFAGGKDSLVILSVRREIELDQTLVERAREKKFAILKEL